MAQKKDDKEFVKQNFSMELKDLERLKKYCEKHGSSMSWVVRQALNEGCLNMSLNLDCKTSPRQFPPLVLIGWHFL